jgi:hypothetical protein
MRTKPFININEPAIYRHYYKVNSYYFFKNLGSCLYKCTLNLLNRQSLYCELEIIENKVMMLRFKIAEPTFLLVNSQEPF